MSDEPKCDICGEEATCSTGGSSYCDRHCPVPEHDQ